MWYMQYCCDGLIAKSCLTLMTPWTVACHGISKARILEWVAISFFRGSSRSRDRIHISCIAGGFFTTEPPRKHNGILLSHKKNEVMPFAATWMDLEIIIISEVSQTEKDKYHMILLIFKKRYKWTYLQNRNRPTQKTNLWLPKEKAGGRDSGVNIYTLLYIM